MAAKLIEPTETIQVNQICALIYGQPGSRKSSLAQTTEEPITLAFDPGIYRAFGRKKAVLFDTWGDVLQFDLRPYQTIVVDTVGMCLDKLTAAIIQDNPKHGNRLGGLTLQGYGQLKSQFAGWVGSIRERGQSLVFTAHEKAEKLGDDVYYCPDIVGGSYNTLMNHADIVGYMHFAHGKRVIDFSPTDGWMAKTPPCGWGTVALPEFEREPNFFGRLLQEAKASMGRISAASAQVAKVVEHWQNWIIMGPDLGELNKRLPELGLLKGTVKAQCWHLCQECAKNNGWDFDKTNKVFVGRESRGKETGA